MKRVFIIIAIVFLIVNISFSEESSKKYTQIVKEWCNKFSDENVRVRLKIKKELWKILMESPHEVMPLIIEELNNKDELVVLYLEALLYEITEYNCYGICVGNKRGIEEWRRWWERYKDKFAPHSDDLGYYEYFYVTQRNFKGNIPILFWKNVKLFNLPIPKYLQEEKPTVELEKLIKRVWNRVIDNKGKYDDFCVIELSKVVLDYIGRPVIPYTIDSIYIGNDKYGNQEGLGWVGSDYLKNLTGEDPYQEHLEAETHIKWWDKYGKDYKWLQGWWRDWWDKNSKSFEYKINRDELDKSGLYRRKIEPALTHELEKKIREIVKQLVNGKDKKEKQQSRNKLVGEIGQNCIPYLIEVLDGVNDMETLKLIEEVFSSIVGGGLFSERSVEEAKNKRKKIWEEIKERFYRNQEIENKNRQRFIEQIEELERLYK